MKISSKFQSEAALGYRELCCGHFWLSVLSECLSCYLYVFIVCSTRISWTGAIIGHEPNLLAMALSSGIAMMLLIFTFRTVHVNPALTISFLLVGRIPIIRAILYVMVHCLGSVAAIAFLYSISVRGHAGSLGLDNPHDSLESWQILFVEAMISFVVTLATYATCNYSSYTNSKKNTLDKLTYSTIGAGSDSLNKCYLTNPNYQDYVSHYENEYDNHRIYATQQLKSRQGSPQVPMEEIMHDECQLLAPNGFALHLSSGQAFVIGLAYTLTSLSGIPASGASLNPARSFGPAFIMNHWSRHWIYWLGPIVGAVIAGFFYEYVFSPTQRSSLCYRPKLFRISAQDMAKVGSRSRLCQQHQQQKLSIPASLQPPPSTIYRPQVNTQQYNPSIHHSPTSSTSKTLAPSNLISNLNFLNSSRPTQLIPQSTTMGHVQQPSFAASNTMDQMSYLHHLDQLHQQQQQHQHDSNLIYHQPLNLDRSKSIAIINSMTAKPHQSTKINLMRNNPMPAESGKSLEPRIDPIFVSTQSQQPPISEL